MQINRSALQGFTYKINCVKGDGDKGGEKAKRGLVLCLQASQKEKSLHLL